MTTLRPPNDTLIWFLDTPWAAQRGVAYRTGTVVMTGQVEGLMVQMSRDPSEFVYIMPNLWTSDLFVVLR